MLPVTKNEEIKLNLPSFNVDGELHKKLNDHPLLSLMNRHFAAAFIGRAGSGKTSLLTGLFATKKCLKKVFHKVIMFIPPNSMASVKNSIFHDLPEEQIISELTLQTLQEQFALVEEIAQKGKNTCIIFDDVQQFYKGETEHLLTHMVNNRRHNRLSLMFVAQSYIKMPRSIRQALTDLFIFKISKSDFLRIYQELVEVEEARFQILLEMFKNSKLKSFLYINVPTQRSFLNWDEVHIDDVTQTDSHGADGKQQKVGSDDSNPRVPHGKLESVMPRG